MKSTNYSFRTAFISLLTLVLVNFSGVNVYGQESIAVNWHTADSLLEKVRQDYRIAGFSVAVVHKDSVLYAKGFGYRDLDKKLPATAETQYAIGSSTKAFTAGLIGKLFADSLSLDDKVFRHLPALQFQDGRETRVTVRDLMAHRTGLDRYDLSWYLFNTHARDSLLTRVKYMTPSFDLRAGWLYNNFMYLAQGMIAEKMTGKSWEENIRKHFFAPLHMSQSSLDIQQLQAHAQASLGYTQDANKQIKSTPYYAIQGMGPAGSINSSVSELVNWLKVWLNGGKYQGQQILPERYVRDAMSPQMVLAANPPRTKQANGHLSGYGLGWMTGMYRDHYHVEHGGNIDGFSASVSFFPADSLGIIVLTNQNSSSAPAVIRNLLADQVLGLPFVKWHADSPKPDSTETEMKPVQEDLQQVKGTSPSHLLTDYSGKYSHPAYGEFEIRVGNDSLNLSLAGKHYHLQHYHYDTFTLRETADQNGDSEADDMQRISFSTGFDGAIKSVELMLPEPVEFTRQISAKAVSAADFNAYIGQYVIGKMTIRVTVENNVLYMDVPGQKNYETIAQGDHYFKMKDLSGFAIRFELDASTGRAHVLQLIQPNGTFAAKRKGGE